MLFPLFYTLTEVSGIGLNVVRSTWLITVINIVAFIVNTALLYLLVPKFGAKGAAMASATAFWLFFILPSAKATKLPTVAGVLSYVRRSKITPLGVVILA